MVHLQTSLRSKRMNCEMKEKRMFTAFVYVYKCCRSIPTSFRETTIPASILLLLLSLFLVSAPAWAKTPVFDPEVAYPDVIEPLLTNSLNDLSPQQRIQLASHFAHTEHPAMASYLLDAVANGNADPHLLDIRFRIAASVKQYDRALGLAKELIETLKPSKQVSSDLWDERLAYVLSWLHEYSYWQQGRELAEKASKRFPDWPKLAAQALHFQLETESWEEIGASVRERVINCPSSIGCLELALVLRQTGHPELAQLAVIQAWRTARSFQEQLELFRFTDRSDSPAFSERMLQHLFQQKPTDAQIVALASAAKHSRSWLAKQLDGNEKQPSELLWARIMLLIQSGDTKQAVALLPPLEKTPLSAEQLYRELFVVRQLLDALGAGAEKAVVQAREHELLHMFPPKTLSPLWRLRLLSLVREVADPKTKQVVLAEVQKLAEPDNLFVHGAELRIRQQMGQGESVANLLRQDMETNAKDNLSVRSVMIEQAMQMNRDGCFDSDSRAREALADALSKLVPKQLTHFVLLQALESLTELDKRFEVAELLRKIDTETWSVAQRLEISHLILANRLNREAGSFLESIQAAETRDRLEQIEQLFLADRHEQAQAVCFALENDAANSSLDLARRLLPHYLNYRSSLTFLSRQQRIGLDIFTQLIIRNLLRHIDQAKASADWATVIDIVTRMMQERIKDEKRNSLRKALWEVDVDLDAVLFDVYQRFQSFGPQPLDRRLTILTALVKAPNPDFFSVAWQHVAELKLSASQLQHLIRALSLRRQTDMQPLIDELMEKWLDALDEDTKDHLLAAHALQASAAAIEQQGVQQSEIDRLQSKQEDIEILQATLDRMDKRIQDARNAVELVPAHATLELTAKAETHGFNTAEVNEQMMHYDWLLEDCLLDTKGLVQPVSFSMEATTDRYGQIRQVSFSKAPSGIAAERTCLRNRLKGLTLANVEAPFGVGFLIVRIDPTRKRGMTVLALDHQEQQIKLTRMVITQHLDDLKSERSRRMDAILQQQKLARRLMMLAYRSSFDPAIYRTASWWFDVMGDDPEFARKIKGEVKWIQAAKLSPVALLALVVVWLLRRRRKKKR